jgi:uncharacterized OsmC-like protein
MTEAIRAAVESASAYLTEHPDEAAYTDSAATAVLGDGLHVRVTGPAGELLETDMPAAVGGSGTGASPGWFFRASMAACVASLVGMRAAQLGIEGLTCEVEVDSASDDRGILGIDPSVPAGPASIRIGLRLSANDAAPADLEALGRWSVEHCPVSEAAGRAIPLDVDITTA